MNCRKSCGHCVSYMTGNRQFCKESKNLSIDELDQGTPGNWAIHEENQTFKVPEVIESKHAGPFVRAGVVSTFRIHR